MNIKKKVSIRGRIFHAEAWSSREPPFCWARFDLSIYSAYGGRLSIGMGAALLGAGIRMSTYWRGHEK
jgi:hypothetical protein